MPKRRLIAGVNTIAEEDPLLRANKSKASDDDDFDFGHPDDGDDSDGGGDDGRYRRKRYGQKGGVVAAWLDRLPTARLNQIARWSIAALVV